MELYFFFNLLDKKTETYSVLAVDYEHYAVIFACYDDPSGNGSTCKYKIYINTKPNINIIPDILLLT